MHTSSIELEGEELIKITKQVIKPNSVQCLWNTSAGQNGKATKCQVQLVCWEAYHRHLLVCHIQPQKNKFYCGIQDKCTAENAGRKSFKGVQDVEKHVTTSHVRDRLRSLAFDCPVKDCRTAVTVRTTSSSSVENHFRESHPDLYGRTIILPSDRLRLLWTTFAPPLINVQDFPPVSPAACLVPPVLGKRKHALSMMPEIELKPDRPKTPDIKFEDLATTERYNIERLGYERVAYKNIIEDCIIAENAWDNHLSRPQAVLNPEVFGYRILPQSILWEAFAARLDERKDERKAAARALENDGDSESEMKTASKERQIARKTLG
ncbi:hypothetical protein BJ165DRAFT_730917 [Panaeolus papilionaceus]|nr:hypothetical protein BJ165DRAFT_730917 [Panaeolus papilionaceus]